MSKDLHNDEEITIDLLEIANILGIGPNFGVGLLHECGST